MRDARLPGSPNRATSSIGILGTSLGSCLSLLTAAHEPLIRAQALNHISPYFADVVWRGLSTTHVRAGLEGRSISSAAPDVAAHQPAGLSRSRARQEDAAGLCEIRSDVPGRSFARSGRANSSAAAFRTSWRSCPAATTRRASRRSNILDGFVLARFLDRNL